MAELKLSSSDTVLLAPAGTASPVGWQVIVSGSTDWVGSIVLKQNTAPPGSTRTLVSVALQNPNTGEEIAAGTAITASGARIVSPTGGDLYVVYTHTSGTVNVRANPATQGVTDNELETAFLAAGFETSGQDTPVTQLSAAVAMLLGQSLDVKAFGAVGDGVTDDTEAIQAAIDAIRTQGGQVFFPSGIYIINDTLVVPTDRQVDFVGEAQGTVESATPTFGGAVIRRGSAFAGYMVSQTGVLSPRAAHGMHLRHLTFSGEAVAGDGLLFDFAANVQLFDVLFHRINGHAMVGFGFINCNVEDSRWYRCGSATKAAVWLDHHEAFNVASSTTAFVGCQWENNLGTSLYLSNDNDPTKAGTSDIQVVGGKFEQSSNFNDLPQLLCKATQHSYFNAVFSNGGTNAARHIVFGVPDAGGSAVNSRRVVVDGRFTVFSGTDADNPKYLVEVLAGCDIIIRGTFHHGGGDSGAQIYVAPTSTDLDENQCENIRLDPSNAYHQSLSGVVVEGIPANGVGADRGDAGATLVAGIDAEVQRWATTLTANATIHLSKTAFSGRRLPWTGARFRIVRTGLGSFTLNVLNGFGGPSIKVLPSATAAWLEAEYDGSDWVLTGYGTL